MTSRVSFSDTRLSATNSVRLLWFRSRSERRRPADSVLSADPARGADVSRPSARRLVQATTQRASAWHDCRSVDAAALEYASCHESLLMAASLFALAFIP
jgi:hypothetical protein